MAESHWDWKVRFAAKVGPNADPHKVYYSERYDAHYYGPTREWLETRSNCQCDYCKDRPALAPMDSDPEEYYDSLD